MINYEVMSQVTAVLAIMNQQVPAPVGQAMYQAQTVQTCVNRAEDVARGYDNSASSLYQVNDFINSCVRR